MKEDVPRFVHDSFYPDGWEKRQYDDLARVLDAEPENVDVVMLDGVPVGWVCTRVHPEDQGGDPHPRRRPRPSAPRHRAGPQRAPLPASPGSGAPDGDGRDRKRSWTRTGPRHLRGRGFRPVAGGALLQGPRPAGDGRHRGVRMFAAHAEPRTSRARFTRCAAPGTPVSTCARRCPGSGWSKDAWPDPGTRRSPRPPSPPSPRPSGGRAWSAAATPPAGAR